MLFKDIVGLEPTKSILLQAVQNEQVAHAQIFLGKEGCANLVLAWAYVTYLNCTNKQPDDACGVCPSCAKMKKMIHPDVHFIFPVAPTKKVESKPLSKDFLADWRKFLLQNPYQNLGDWLNFIGAENKQGNISVEESRNMLNTLTLKPFEAEYKTILLWLPELMNISAANAMLKILEEPPQKTLFILVCQDEKKLLATIISRVQRVQIPDFSDEEVVYYLTQKHSLENYQAMQLAYLAEGNLNEAIRLLHENTHGSFDVFRQWMLACYGDMNNKQRVIRFDKIVAENEKLSKLTKEEHKKLLTYGLSICREILMYQYDSKNLIRLQGDELAFVERFSRFFSLASIEKMYENLNEALHHLERNANAKITFLDLSIKIAQGML